MVVSDRFRVDFNQVCQIAPCQSGLQLDIPFDSRQDVPMKVLYLHRRYLHRARTCTEKF